MLRSDLCDQGNVDIVVKGTVTVADPNNNVYDKNQSLKIMHHLFLAFQKYDAYSKNYLKTSRSLWNYYTDEPNSGTVGNTYYSIKDSKSFDYKISITGKLENNNVEKEYVEIVVPLK